MRTSLQQRAHAAVHAAIKKGILTRPSRCSNCGLRKPNFKRPLGTERHRIIAHHDDYSKPLDVKWWCERCHQLHHFALDKLNGIDRGRNKTQYQRMVEQGFCLATVFSPFKEGSRTYRIVRNCRRRASSKGRCWQHRKK